MRSELDTETSNEQRSPNALTPTPHPYPAAPQVRPGGRRLVESVRLIMVPLFAGAGWQTASALTHARTQLLAGVVVGSGVGYVLGGVFGRRTVGAVSKVEREFRRISAGDILAGSIGLVLGLVMAVLVSVPLFHLPSAAAYPTVAFVYLTLGFLGYRIGRTKATDLFALFGMKPRAAGTPAGEVCVVDTSALLDGRTLTLVRMAICRGRSW